MMEGALTGKTGFTADAGYCYVGALSQDDRTFIVALLGCGWPGHKNYKWEDTRKLMEYGLANYAYRKIGTDDMKAGQEDSLKTAQIRKIYTKEARLCVRLPGIWSLSGC